MSWWKDFVNGGNPHIAVPGQVLPPAQAAYPQVPSAEAYAPAPPAYPLPSAMQGVRVVYPASSPEQPSRALAKVMGRQNNDIGRCPSCDGTNYSARKVEGIPKVNTETGQQLTHGVAICFDCGYPQTQFGSETGDGGALLTISGGGKSSGHAREADSFHSGFHAKTWEPHLGGAGAIRKAS